MNQRGAHLLQILEYIGFPLIGAAVSHAPPDSSDPVEEAKAIAEMLAISARASVEMGKALDTGGPDIDDSMRVTLAALASQLVASLYSRHGKIPGEAEVKRLQAALPPILTFADNFQPGEAQATRLKDIRAQGQPADALQINVQYIQAFIPVIEAVSKFPFGQADQKLLTEIAEKLTEKAKTIRSEHFGEPGRADEKRIELGLLSGLARVYADCHMQETQRLMRADPEKRGHPDLKPVWEAFETRASLLDALVRHLQPGKTEAAAPTQPTNTVQTQTQEKASVAPIPASPPPDQPAENPLAMFAKKPAQSPAQQPESASEAKPSPEEITTDAEPDSSAVQPAAGNNPMAFFKPDAKNDDED